MAGQLAKARRYWLYVASRQGVPIRSASDAQAVKLVQIEMELLRRPGGMSRAAVKSAELDGAS